MTQLKVLLFVMVAALVGVTTSLGLSVRSAHAAEVSYAKGDVAVGEADAPVTVIEYASMTCPHCARFHIDTFKDFKKKYVDTGQVRMIFREFPFDEQALRASMLARCSGEDRYFAVVDLLFTQKDQWVGKQNYLDVLAQLARFTGMSRETFNACMASEALVTQILQTRKNGHEEFEVASTPSFVVNGDLYTGAMTLSEWDDILAKYLN